MARIFTSREDSIFLRIRQTLYPARRSPDIHNALPTSKSAFLNLAWAAIAKTRVPPALCAIRHFTLHKILAPSCGRPALD
jgi:hypothetical protein